MLRLLALLALLGAPLALALHAGPGGITWLALGALTWALSVGLKLALARPLRPRLASRAAAASAAALGLLSAATELGAALLAFRLLPSGTPALAAAFGAGAGGVEALVLLGVGVAAGVRRKRSGAALPKAAELPWHVRATFFVERGGALLGHTGARGLVWLGAPGWLGLAGFALVDGLASYGKRQGWDWLELRIWVSYYGLVWLVGAAELLAFLGWSP